MKCKFCEEFEKARRYCTIKQTLGECDCPKCQGYCACPMEDEPKSPSKVEGITCPSCNGPTNVLLFMGCQPDGFICPKCHLYLSPKGEPLATVIC